MSLGNFGGIFLLSLYRFRNSSIYSCIFFRSDSSCLILRWSLLFVIKRTITQISAIFIKIIIPIGLTTYYKWEVLNFIFYWFLKVSPSNKVFSVIMASIYLYSSRRPRIVSSSNYWRSFSIWVAFSHSKPNVFIVRHSCHRFPDFFNFPFWCVRHSGCF